MKITFEGNTYLDILDQMESMLSTTSKIISKIVSEKTKATAIPSTTPVAEPQGPGPKPMDELFADHPSMNAPVDTPVNNPVGRPAAKPEKVRSAKQLENDERLRKLALEKIEAKKAAKAAAPEPKPVPPPKTAEGMDPAEVVKVRQKTIEDLQAAYAGGFQKEVFELLSRFGNGAKSFRELPPDAFVPIREAIDNGALT